MATRRYRRKTLRKKQRRNTQKRGGKFSLNQAKSFILNDTTIRINHLLGKLKGASPEKKIEIKKELTGLGYNLPEEKVKLATHDKDGNQLLYENGEIIGRIQKKTPKDIADAFSI